MKTKLLVSLISAAVAATATAATPEAGQLQVYPKNLARQHLGANLLLYKESNQSYVPTEAAAAWLDDDVTTGWPILAGKQYYLLALPTAELMTNFSVSAKAAGGTVTLYAGDEPARPGAATWKLLAKELPMEAFNQRKLTNPFSREAKYLLIETNFAEPGPMYSLHVYTDAPAVGYQVSKREQALDSRAVFGSYVNDRTTVNLAGLYSGSMVSESPALGGMVGWQKAIDDNPESALQLTASTDKPGAVVRFSEPRSVSRIAVLTDPNAKGQLEFFVSSPAVTADAAASESLAGATPVTSITLDGSAARSAVDFPAVTGTQVAVRWTPANGADTVAVHEVNAFGEPTVSTYAVSMKPELIAERGSGDDLLADSSKGDGKDFKNFKEAMDPAEPIADLTRGPFLPGALGFPPNPSLRSVIQPPTVVSP